MVRILIFAFTLLVALNDLQGQVPQKIIVEHFTNTRCGLCSSRNPGFYNVYNKNPGILHISYHPSRPYANCFLHLHNKAENDDRTKYYNIYGSTPKFVIQGKNNTQYAQDSVYEPYQNMMSDVSISLKQYIDEAGQINAEISVKNETGVSLNNASIFIGVAEALVYYEAPNRENEHHDVFRKAFTPAEGESINLNETLNASYKIDVHTDWDLQQLYVYAIVQDATTKTVIQAEAAEPGIERTTVGINNYQIETTAFYPNPAASFIYSNANFSEVEIYNNKGQLVYNGNTNVGNKIDINQLNKGLYFIKALTIENSIVVQKFLKE